MRRFLIGPALTVAFMAALLAGISLAPRPANAAVDLDPGFRATTIARGLDRPTALAVGPDGRLYVTEEPGALVSLPGRGGRARPFLDDLNVPLGVLWVGRDVYVAQRGSVLRATLSGGRATARRLVVRGLPFELHQQDGLAHGRDGRVYLGSGSTCDVCEQTDPRSAAVLSFLPDGSDLRIVATGLRNPYGLTVHPRTGAIYATVNGQDELGSNDDPEPAELLVKIQTGLDFGWPGCWPSARLLRLVGACRGVARPSAYLEPHSAPAGLDYYDATMFPVAYREQFYVAEWGTYFGRRVGRRVVRVDPEPGGPGVVRVFASGIEHPIDVDVAPDGSLLVLDYGRLGTRDDGRIIRISRA